MAGLEIGRNRRRASRAGGGAILDAHVGTGGAQRLVVMGADFHHAAVEVRERLAFPAERLADGLRVLSAYAGEGLILSTCNRVEVYAVVDAADDHDAVSRVIASIAEATGLSPSMVESVTSARAGTDAAHHLFRVACGLESMVLGEPQILGQIRDALDAARDAGMAGPVVSRLGTDALRVGKKARTETEIARNKTSIAHAAVALAAREFSAACPILMALDRMDFRQLPCPSPMAHAAPLRGRRAVVVGAGPMATLAARLLRAGQVGELVIANRTIARATDLAERTGGTAAGLDRLPDLLAAADLAIVATGGGAVITPATIAGIARGGAPVVLIDVGLPRCVDPAVADDPRVLLRDVDALEEIAAGYRAGHAAEIIHVEHHVAAATDAWSAWRAARVVAPAIAGLRRRADAIREAELERALARLGHLSERDRQVVSALASGLTNKLLHHPTAALNRADNPDRTGDAAAMARLFGLGFTPTAEQPASSTPGARLVAPKTPVCPVTGRALEETREPTGLVRPPRRIVADTR